MDRSFDRCVLELALLEKWVCCRVACRKEKVILKASKVNVKKKTDEPEMLEFTGLKRCRS